MNVSVFLPCGAALGLDTGPVSGGPVRLARHARLLENAVELALDGRAAHAERPGHFRQRVTRQQRMHHARFGPRERVRTRKCRGVRAVVRRRGNENRGHDGRAGLRARRIGAERQYVRVHRRAAGQSMGLCVDKASERSFVLSHLNLR